MVSKEQYRRETMIWLVIIAILAISFMVALMFAIDSYGKMKYQKSKADSLEKELSDSGYTWNICDEEGCVFKNNKSIRKDCEYDGCNWICDEGGMKSTTLIKCGLNLSSKT